MEIVREMPTPHSGDTAKVFVDTVLNTIEDEFSGVPYNPQTFEDDGRLYPAQEDFRQKSPVPNVAVYFHKAHASYFGDNGSIRISRRRPPQVLIERAGCDGITIGELLEHETEQLPGSSSRKGRKTTPG